MALTPVRGAPTPRKFAVYDLEWVPETYELRLAGYFDGQTYKSFTRIEDLLNFLLVPERADVWCYAHAGGLADMHFLLDKIQHKKAIKLTASFSGSSAIVVKVTWGKHVFQFLDSYWLLRDKLAHLAPYTGIAKDRAAYTCDSYPACGHVGRACDSAPSCGCAVGPEPLCMFRAPLPILRDYNERDCRILYRAIELFQEQLAEMGTVGVALKTTIASTALQTFRSVYLAETIQTPDRAMNDRLRDAYVASRVEVLRKKVVPGVKGYDFNSMFPFAMMNPLPGALLGTSKHLPEDSTLYFADATVHVPDMFLPPLGARGRDDRIYFPTGRWRSLFSRADLELLQKHGGRIDAVHDVTLFHAFHDLAHYALDLFERRKAAKKAGQTFLALVLKYLLNSCYGKFGEHRDKVSLVMHGRSERCPHGGEHDRMTRQGFESTCVEPLFPGVVLVSDEKDVPHEHVAIAATITSIARATLYEGLAKCGEDLYYCDTDSIWTGAELPTGDALGALKLEYEVVRGGRFVQPKLYEIDDKVKSKGFSRLTRTQFEDLVEGRQVEVERMYRVKEIARELKTFGAKGKTFGKQIRLGQSRPKRRELGDGSTAPWTYQEIQEKWRPDAAP